MMTLFQSTHPTRECDQFFNRFLDRIVKFQSTHPTRECDSNAGRAVQSSQYFNPRTLQESATSQRINQSLAGTDFNPRTLQESATNEQRENFMYTDISIHAPYKRVRPWSVLMPLLNQHNFNPRTLQESATAIYSKKITFSQYIGLKILIRNKKYPSLK